MSERRKAIVDRIVGERERQFMLPGSESDSSKTANDWLMTVIDYVVDARQRGATSVAAFEDGLEKAAAVILAALEHTDVLQRKGHLV